MEISPLERSKNAFILMVLVCADTTSVKHNKTNSMSINLFNFLIDLEKQQFDKWFDYLSIDSFALISCVITMIIYKLLTSS
jgi:hypothetical protein